MVTPRAGTIVVSSLLDAKQSVTKVTDFVFLSFVRFCEFVSPFCQRRIPEFTLKPRKPNAEIVFTIA